MIPLSAPEFWWRQAGARAALLYPAGAIYGAIAAQRMQRSGYCAKIPVLCIGNPTLGGAGKTPAAIAIGERLKRAGKKVFFLTRGYGGSETGPLLVDLSKHDARMIGDEAPLLAAIAPTIVAKDRAAGAKLAEATGAELIIMDDGFQNPSLEKNFSMLLVDGAKGIGNGMVFPAGPLRAPLAPQFSRAQAMIVVGEGEAGEKAARLAGEYALPVFAAKLEADQASADALAGKHVLAFAGIGAPEKFFRSLEAAGATVAARKRFGDHHCYTKADADALLAEAKSGRLELVTTEKDLTRMRGVAELAPLGAQAKTLRVHLVFEDESAPLAAIESGLAL